MSSQLLHNNGICNKAFDLAFFINGDRASALTVTCNAFLNLELAAAAQNKRLYYKPAKREGSRSDVTRTKICLSEEHLLQRLIYIESEPFEKAREARSIVNVEALIVHFVKHLARITIKRNSFYVALGLSRLLYDYSTTQAMEIYNVVVQDPERVKDDYYYRSRKARLVEEINERFGELIEMTRGARGEERIRSTEISGEQRELVVESLRRFTPWETPCILPVGFDPMSEEVQGLSSSGGLSDEVVETNRIHTVLDPECYERLAASLRLEPPAGKLKLPYFFLQKGGNDLTGHGSDRRRSPGLTDAELDALKHNLADQSSRRKRSYAGVLAIVVDGVESGTLELSEKTRTSVSIKDSAELVQVFARDASGDLLLGAHFLSLDSDSSESIDQKAEIVLEAGQKLTFNILQDSQFAVSHRFDLVVDYEETAPARRLALRVRQLNKGLSHFLPDYTNVRLPLSGGVLALLALVLVGTIAWVTYRSMSSTRQEHLIAQNLPVNSAELKSANSNSGAELNLKNQATTSESKADGNTSNSAKSFEAGLKGFDSGMNIPAGNTASKKSPEQSRKLEAAPTRRMEVPAASGSPDGGTEAFDPNRTRSVEAVVSTVDLKSVRRVFIEESGGENSTQDVVALLRLDKRLSSKWVIVEKKEDADAVLKIKTVRGIARGPVPGTSSTSEPSANANKAATTPGGPVLVQLVNEEGTILWPIGKGNTTGKYAGPASDIARKIATDLAADLERVNKLK